MPATRYGLCVFLLHLLAVSNLMAEKKEVEISAAYQHSRFVQSFPDPLYVGETDYISSSADQGRLRAQFDGFFIPRFAVAYQALSVQSYSEARQNTSYQINGYYTSFLSLMASSGNGLFRWHYGITAMATFGYRSHTGPSGQVVSDRAIDTRLSQAYPSGGFTLFPLAPVRFSMVFLDGNANLLYGWLRMQAEFETDHHIFAPGFELLNHASFGKGFPNFVQPPGAFTFGYTYKLEAVRMGMRLGFVLNSLQGFDNARVSFADRLVLEMQAAYAIRIAPAARQDNLP